MIKILFLDKSNIVCSAMACIMLKEKAQELNLNLQALSAGLETADGLTLSGDTLKALWLRGYDGDDFTTTLFNNQMINDVDYVIIMSKQLRFALPKSDKIISFGEMVNDAEIKPPIAEEFASFLDVASDIDRYTDVLIEKFKN